MHKKQSSRRAVCSSLSPLSPPAHLTPSLGTDLVIFGQKYWSHPNNDDTLLSLLYTLSFFCVFCYLNLGFEVKS